MAYNLKDKKFGKLFILRRATPEEAKTCDSGHVTSTPWVCACDCGVQVIKRSVQLMHTKYPSCNICYADNRAVANKRNGIKRRKEIAPVNELYKSYIGNAERRGIVFDISIHLFLLIIKQECLYCGCLPSANYRHGGIHKLIYNGIDRYDNAQGYIPSNVVPCCKECNYLKRTKTIKNFIGRG